MRVYVGFFILALAAASAAAQDTPPTPTQAAKVNAELAATAASAASTESARVNGVLAASLGSSMKNSPFSADEVNESVQTLADGNRIVRSSSGKMYRNSEGRVRRESKGGTGGSFGFTYSVTPSISIVNPVDRQKYELDSALKTARIYDMGAGQNLTIAGANLKSADEALAKLKAEGKLSGTGERLSEELIAKLKAEGKLSGVQVMTGGMGTGVSSGIAGDAQKVFTGPAGVYSIASGAYGATDAKYHSETKTEELGTRDFEGVAAEGTRRTTIIPAGAIGNDRPIETVYERWYSKELGVVVYSKTTDPRMGEQTYKLTNVVRSEPDPSLFAVPTEYKKIGQSGATYRVVPTRPVAVKSTTAPKTAASAKPVTAVGRP